MTVWLIILTIAVLWCGWSIFELCKAIKTILEIIHDMNEVEK